MKNKVSKKEEKLKEEARKISIREGSAYSVMDGFGLRYITPYAIALGATDTHIGLLSSLPNLLGSFFQLHTIKVMNHSSRRKIVFLGVLLQALMWIALILIGGLYFIFHVNSQTAPALLIVIYSLLVMVGAFAGPAWSSWMKDIIPKDLGRYFGIRNRSVGFVALVCMLLAGFLLDYFKQWSLFLGFVVIFTIAFIGRAYSAYLFTKQYEPKFVPEKKIHFSIMHFLKSIFRSSFGKFTIFISMISFSVAISSPFFAVYMLENLKFDYVSYILVAMASVISMLIFMPAWGKFSDKYGNLKILRICGAAIPLVPLLWFMSIFISPINSNLIVPYLIVIELFSGFIWAGFNLAAGNFIYAAADTQKIAPLTSYFSIISNIGVFAGALIGGVLASLPNKIFGLSAILFVFLFSALMRYLVFASISPDLDEVRPVKKFGLEEARKRFMHLNFHEILRIIR